MTLSLLLAITTMTLLPGHSVHDHVFFCPVFSCWPSVAAALRHRVPTSASCSQSDYLGPILAMDLAPLGLIAVRPFVSRQVFILKTIFVSASCEPLPPFPFVVLALLGLMIWRGRRATLPRTGTKGRVPLRNILPVQNLCESLLFFARQIGKRYPDERQVNSSRSWDRAQLCQMLFTVSTSPRMIGPLNAPAAPNDS